MNGGGEADELVIARREGNLALLTLNRPARRNALNTPLLTAFLDALAGARDAGAVVLAGAGGTFSAGADVAEEIGREDAVARMRLFARLYGELTTYPRPTVAAIDGWCIGGGAEIATACDLRVGAPSARIRFPGASFGIPAGASRLPLLVGLSHAKDLLMTARTIDADEAARIGLLNRLVPEEGLLAEALDLARTLAATPGAMSQKRALEEACELYARAARENRALVRWQEEAPGLMG